MTVSEGWGNSRFIHRHCPVRWGIGFTDNSNPFYLFLKMNAGLLLLAPFALRREKSIPS
ncbi:hypothetical protein COMA2_150080 [Candidatus Nitrospira nitrificans]|uniref:Uncharacterized protein n=1 Tax=Candidatus Nitrospira nitrificans TaxID=1742973 RepID=A0A0S4LA34_9BACT|nr:hypothetical protein COMA2_150080 [Candidatus Nitrospira nitrificans]